MGSFGFIQLFFLCIVLLVFPTQSLSQTIDSVYFIGCTENIDSHFVTKSTTKSIQSISWDSVRSIYLFSSSHSELDSTDLKEIGLFIYEGGNLYLGFDNVPFQAEGNQILAYLFQQQTRLEIYNNTAKINFFEDKKNVFQSDTFSSGFSVSTFPMDYRWKVLAWCEDQPILVEASLGKGKIILDGGYARFQVFNAENQALWNSIQLIFCSNQDSPK